jgi:HSP20 family molecular chaperone IbpA
MSRQELTPKEKQELKGQEQTRPGRFYIPAVDIWEDEDGLTVYADLPGADPDKVHVELNADVLTIVGEVALADYQGLAPVFTEYNVGHFQRRFSIPDSGAYDCDRIQARSREGVLEVTIPRSEASKPRRIPVAAA